jgi:hypothetical protein
MQESSRLLNQHKVVVNAPFANERALVAIHQRLHPRGQARSQRLRHQFGEDVDQANWPVVTQSSRIRALGQQD